ncbi:MAG: carbohydrate kinase family protein [Clostridia bacterium]|nr:carbohydrate kinase family protein [Clostridia bacterium]
MLDILFAGELNVDVILSGVKQAPVFGKEILCEDYQEVAGGSTGNCACAAASLGLKSAMFSKLGKDRFGEILLNTLKKYDMDLRFMDISEKYQTGATVSLCSDSDRAMITHFGDTIDAFDAEEIPLEAAGARHLHAGSFYLQPRVRKGLPAVFKRAQELGMTTSLDAGWDEHGNWHDSLDDILPHTDYFLPNESEAVAITGDEDPASAAVKLAAYGCNVVVKYGAKGSFYCPRFGGEAKFYPGYKSFVHDTTGAGDSFNAGFLYGALRGWEIGKAMQLGNAVGALSVQRNGGSENCPTLEEALAVMEKGTAL